MADGTKIEWTEATWNPITGCSVASPGCTNCYAMRLAGTRMRHYPTRQGLTTDTKAGPVWNGQVRFVEQVLDQPLRWKRPRMVFVAAHGDLFHEAVPVEWIDRVFAVMALAPQHTFQVLTKRPERMRAYLSQFRRQGHYVVSDRITSSDPRDGNRFLLLRDGQSWPLPNVWLGTSVEDQARADERIPFLLDTPAAVRWISAEPLLGPVFFEDGYEKLDWCVIGGESGPSHRSMDPAWARTLRDQCAGKVAFFMKQMAGKGPIPPDLMVREWPASMTPIAGLGA